MKTYRIRFVGRKIGEINFRQFTVKVRSVDFDSAYKKLSKHYEHITYSRQVPIL